MSNDTACTWRLQPTTNLNRATSLTCDTMPTVITKPHGPSRLAPKKVRAVELLALGLTVAHVARELGLARETCSRWQREPAFSAALAARRQELETESAARVQALTGKAVVALSKALEEPGERVAAARVVLHHSVATPAKKLAVEGTVLHAHAAVDEPLSLHDLALLAEVLESERGRLLPAVSTADTISGVAAPPGAESTANTISGASER